jgi:hypothetical protein
VAVPSRPAQIKRIAEFLEDSANAERTVQEVATRIVDGIYDMWAVDVTEAPQVPKVDMAFKTPNLTSKVYHVAWIGREFASEGSIMICWVIEAGSDFGMFVPLQSEFWRIVTPSTAKAGSRGKNKDGITPGDRYSLMQRRSHFTVLEVGDKTVLLRDDKFGSLQADSNANIKKYYQRERA